MVFSKHRHQDESVSNWIAVWSGEELQVTFSATPQEEDYGVPGSPTWTVPEDICVEEVKLFGTTIDFKTLPEELQNYISSLAEDFEWPPLE